MNDMSLKAKIRSIALEKNVSAQSVLQIYLLNRFLFRLSESSYSDKFVVKGGMLISSLIGIGQRATMDLDTTLRSLPLTAQSVETAFNEICSMPSDDGLSFHFESIDPIRSDDEYGGFRVCFHAEFGRIKAPMSMDVSTGDIITPGAEKHTFRDMFDGSAGFELWSYPVETVLAEKLETILSRGTENTRPRDFYDVYKLSLLGYDSAVLKDAFEATAAHRGSLAQISRFEDILADITRSAEMAGRWEKYAKQTPYAAGVRFEETVASVRSILSGMNR